MSRGEETAKLWQFSIKGLLSFTLCIGVFLTIVKWIPWLILLVVIFAFVLDYLITGPFSQQ